MPVKKTCVVCGTIFKVPPSRAKTAKACSNECAISVRAKSRERQIEKACFNCGVIFSLPQSHKHRRKYCSTKCKYSDETALKVMSERVSGDKNPMWSGGETNHSDGYVYVHSPEHPFTSSGNYVLKHRLVVEEMLRRDDPESSMLITIKGKRYLRKIFIVHHLDEDRKNNSEENLLACALGDHGRIHHYIVPVGKCWPIVNLEKIMITIMSEDNLGQASTRRPQQKKGQCATTDTLQASE